MFSSMYNCIRMLDILYMNSKYICQLSCVFASFPLSYHSDRGFSTNRLGVVYSFIWLMLAIGHTLITPYYIHENSTLRNSSDVNSFDDFEKPSETDVRQIASDPDIQSTVIRYVNPMLILSMSITSRYVSIFLLPKLIFKLQYSIEKIDFLLSFLMPRNYSLPDYSKKIVIFFVFASVPVNCLYLYFSLPIPPTYRWSGLVWSCLLVFNNLSAFSTEIQFSNYCFMLRSRYRIINNYFNTFKRSSMSQATMENILKMSPFFSLNYHSENYEKRGDIFTVNNLPRLRASRMKQNKVSTEYVHFFLIEVHNHNMLVL